MNKKLIQEYELISPILEEVKNKIVTSLSENLTGVLHIDRIYGRVKSTKSFLGKANKKVDGLIKYPHPLRDILDQIGIRVVVYYLDDLEIVRQRIEDKFRFIKIEEKNKKESDFGYEAVHYTFEIPPDVVCEIQTPIEVQFFELQICTLFQHAWAEANHDLMYKSKKQLTDDQKRALYWAAAQAWGTDKIFSGIKKTKFI